MPVFQFPVPVPVFQFPSARARDPVPSASTHSRVRDPAHSTRARTRAPVPSPRSSPYARVPVPRTASAHAPVPRTRAPLPCDTTTVANTIKASITLIFLLVLPFFLPIYPPSILPTPQHRRCNQSSR